MIKRPRLKHWKTLESLERGYDVTERRFNTQTSRWEEQVYHTDYKEAPFDELHRDAIIQEIVKNHYIIAGDTHQHLAIPFFEDGYILVSMRVWEELMLEAYSVMVPFKNIRPNFYMAAVCSVEEVIPCAQ